MLLRHCEARGTDWTDVGLYGDGWTPLMSAVVAGHGSIVAALLSAAGARAAALLGARNKYGSTALHLAAYRGPVAIIRQLLDCGAHTLAGARDSQGLTPVQIARKNAHQTAAALLARPQDT